MSRLHSIYASVVGIFLGITIGGFSLLYSGGCFNLIPWAIVIAWSFIAMTIYLFYRILRNNAIVYEEIFMKINRVELEILNRQFKSQKT
jgi:hypothetical protein